MKLTIAKTRGFAVIAALLTLRKRQYITTILTLIRVSKSGRAVDTKFRTMYAGGYVPGISLSVIGWLLVLYCLAVYPRAFIEYRNIYKIIKNGREGTATFLESKPHVHMYKIRFSYQGDDLKTHTVWSERVYNQSALIAIKDMKEIPIQYYGDKAVIVIVAVDQYLQANQKRLLG